MTYKPETPFDSIEGALEYVSLLAETVEETQGEIAAEIAEAKREGAGAARRAEALQLVAYKLDRLVGHARASRRLLNDLRTLRRLLLDERGQDEETARASVAEEAIAEELVSEDQPPEPRRPSSSARSPSPLSRQPRSHP